MNGEVAGPGDRSGSTAGQPSLIRPGLRGFLDLERLDVLLVVGFTLLAFVIRFASPVMLDFLGHPGGGSPVRAYGVRYPYNDDSHGCQSVPVGPQGESRSNCGFVFDEVYFPVDAAKDLRQPPESYFDPEPPLAKLLMVPPIAALGFNTWSWRLSTTIAGSLTVGLVYLIARRLRRERFFPSVAALCVSLDGLAIVESRTGVIDMIAIFFVALVYYVFLLHWQARTRTQWRCTLYALATVAGLGMAAKLTALAPVVVATALIAVRWLQPLILRALPTSARHERHERHGSNDSNEHDTAGLMWRRAAGSRALLHSVIGALLVGVIFVASFARYDAIAHNDVYFFYSCDPKTGPAANAATLPPAVMPIDGHLVPDPIQAVRNALTITAAGLSYHEQECRSHPFASRWYTWPLMEHPVLFYSSSTATTNDGESAYADVTNMGNPAVWWAAIPALLVCAWLMTRGPTLWRCAIGGLGVGALALLIITFHAAEQAATVRVQPGLLFTVAFLAMVGFCGLAAVSAVVSGRFVPGFIVLSYLTAWMMWVPGNERRVLFFYHALGMLPFAALALAYCLSLLRGWCLYLGPWRLRLAPVAWSIIPVVVAGFLFFYPVWTAIPLSNQDHAMRIWVDTP